MHSSNAEKLQSLALQGAKVFLTTAPRIVVGAFFGAVGGFLTGAVLGSALAGISLWMWRRDGNTLPTWLDVSLILTPVVLALAGGYVGFVRGVLSALAKQVVEKKLLAWVYAQVKPAAMTALKKVGTTDAARIASEVRDEIGRVFAKEEAQAPGPKTMAEKVAHFVTLRSRRMLALSVVAHLARAKTGAEAAEEIEKLGLEKMELIVVSSLEDLFSLKLNLISGAALLVCVLPQIIFWVTRT